MTLTYNDFEESHDGLSLSATIHDYNIEIWRDECAGNPWDEWDGNLPWFNNPSRNQCDFNYGDALDITRHMPDSLTWRQFREVLSAIEYSSDISDLCYNAARIDAESHDSVMAAYRELRESSLVDIACELIASFGHTASDIETIESLYNALGIPCESFASSGYSQGDHIQGLWVATPAWIKTTGINPDSHDWQREWDSSKRLLAAWAWGNVYGFTIERDREYVDSCGGFYSGPLWDSDSDSRIFDVIGDAIKHDQNQRRKARADKLKTLIRQRAPLSIRTAQLSTI